MKLNSVIEKLLSGNGNSIPVSMLPADGTFQTDTSKYNPPITYGEIPIWNPNACTQCGACSIACPQAALRIKVFDDTYLKNALHFTTLFLTILKNIFYALFHKRIFKINIFCSLFLNFLSKHNIKKTSLRTVSQPCP